MSGKIVAIVGGEKRAGVLGIVAVVAPEKSRGTRHFDGCEAIEKGVVPGILSIVTAKCARA
jgi:hypothetical protein